MSNENSIAVIDKCNIKNLIYNIRGQQVMLDSDLALLYGYELKKFNQQVKRNIQRFPKDFMFQISEEEMGSLRSQNVTANVSTMSRSNPYVFTEQGIYMLATVLRGEIAEKQSIMIMRTFKEMRHYIFENNQLLNNKEILGISNRLAKHEESINRIEKNMVVHDDLKELMDNFISEDKVKQFIISNGKKFEANEAYYSIYRQAKQSIYIIDDYINIDTLTLLKHKEIGVDIIIFSDNKGTGRHKLNHLEVYNFNKEYPGLRLKRNNGKVHDRYIILDYKTNNEKIYHCGASSKDAGSKLCGINEILNPQLIHPIINDLLLNKDYM